MKALAKLGALLVLCVALAGVSFADGNTMPEIEAEQVETVVFCSNVTADESVSSSEVNDVESITKIVTALNELDVEQMDTSVSLENLTEENLQSAVIGGYVDADFEKNKNLPDMFVFCKDGTLIVSHFDGTADSYRVDNTMLQEVLQQVAAEHPENTGSMSIGIKKQ